MNISDTEWDNYLVFLEISPRGDISLVYFPLLLMRVIIRYGMRKNYEHNVKDRFRSEAITNCEWIDNKFTSRFDSAWMCKYGITHVRKSGGDWVVGSLPIRLVSELNTRRICKQVIRVVGTRPNMSANV